MTERQAQISLSAFTPFGPARLKLLTSFFKGARGVWSAKKKELLEVGLGEERVEEFLEYRNKFDTKGYFNRLKRLGIKVVTINDDDYPENLREVETAPPVLYFRGKLRASDSVAIAIVGSRKMTSYGKEIAEKFSGELAGYGVTIVSGLARGIDTAAHKSAIESHGRTIAVLGCGLDSIYPPENEQLAKEIVGSGAIISEYPLGFPALRTNFANRNRIISGLSRAVIVIEGAEKSGTLLTASHAAEQGRVVFAVPGQINSPLSAAPLFLLKNGARILTETKDVLEELDLEMKVDRQMSETIFPKSEEEEEILSILENEALHLDEIARISSLEASSVSARLTVMELKGMVKNLGAGVYKKL